MSSFYKRKLKDREVWYVNLVLSDGRRKSINTQCENKAAAKMVAAEFQRKILLGLDPTKPEPPKQNLIALFERFINESRRDWSSETSVMYLDTLSVLKEVIGPIALVDLSRKHRNVIVDYMTERGAIHKSKHGELRKLREISPHTINRRLRHITRFLNWCIEEEIQRGWQPPRFKSVPAIKKAKPSFTPEEISKILDAASGFTLNGQPIKHYLAFKVFSGFRRNEGIYLEYRHIDFEKMLITVPPGKVTKKIQREETVPLTAPLIFILNSLPEPHVGRIFPGITEKITVKFKDVCKAAGVEYKSLHRLRATFATQLNDLGLPRFASKRVVRHKSDETTYDYYYSPEATALREAVNRALENSPFATALLRTFSK